MEHGGRVSRLFDELKSGNIDRRAFIERTTALGVGFTAALFMANGVSAAGSKNGYALYQGVDGTPAASPAAGGGGQAPSNGTEGKTRGQDGDLKLIQWQAPTLASPHVATGDKDFLAGCIVVEPLMHYLPDGTIIPTLIKEVPSVENGLLAKDLSAVTFNLLEGVTWSDGEPFTANDVVFTWKWVTNDKRTSNLSINLAVWGVIKEIVAKDDLTAVVTFKQPSANWFDPFTGSNNGNIYPAHKFNNDPDNPNDEFLTNPIGTGPYVVTNFSPNDQVTYKANDKYRDPNKPYFANVTIKGGGDAASAARAVLETGEYDFGWNIQVEPSILQPMVEVGKGTMLVTPGASVERLNLNFSDPNKEVDGQRSEMNTPNPVIADDAVRKAMNLAVPRDVIATQFYGEGEPATANILTGEGYAFTSPNTSWEFNIDEANKILDDAGWTKNGDVRSKDGVELSVVYATTINQVRQKTQAVVKQAFEKLGVKVQLQQIDAGIFFDSSAGNDQNTSHFYWDIAMYTSGAGSPIPTSFMLNWYAGPDGSNISQKSNGWAGVNSSRWVNADYDAAFDELGKVTTFEEANTLLIKMNDIVIDNVALIPQVNRAAAKSAIINTLVSDNVAASAFEPYEYWNMANWTRTS